MKKSRNGFSKSRLLLTLVIGILLTFSMTDLLNAGAKGFSLESLGKMISSISSQGDSVAVPSDTASDPESPQTTVSITAFGTALTQNFDSLASSGTTNADTTLPTGWYFVESGGQANTTYAADNGGLNTGNTYSYGATSATERALGGLRSSNVNPTIGASFTNNTGKRIGSLAISYIGEQWRLGTAGREDRLEFEYSTNATSLSTGTWTAVTNLNFVAPISSGTAGALVGNTAGNRTSKSGTISGLDIANGAVVWIRWRDVDATSADDGLAVDDFSITASLKVADTSIATSPAAATNSTSAAFTFTADDSDSTFECRLGTGSFSSCVSPVNYTGLADGSYTFEVKASNAAGTDATPASFTWIVDTVAPGSPAIDTKPNALTNQTSASFTFSGGADNVGGSGFAKYQCKLDSGSYTDCTSPQNLTGLSEGSHTFSVRSVDNVGNTGNAAEFTWIVDLTNPEVSLNGPSGFINDATPTFTFSGTDANAVDGYECSLSDATFEACASPLTLTTLADGAYSFRVRSKDSAGNFSEASTLSFTVDTVAPVIDEVPSPAVIENQTAAAVTFEIEELNPMESVKLYYTTLSSMSPVANEGISSLNSVTCSLVMLEPPPVHNPNHSTYECMIPAIQGPTYVSFFIEAVDGAGNSSERPSPSTPNLVAVRGAMGETVPLPPGTYTDASIVDDQQLAGNVEVLGVLSISGPNIVSGGRIILGCDATVSRPDNGSFIIGTVEKRFCVLNELFEYPIGVNEPGVNATDGTQGGTTPVYTPSFVRILEVPAPGSSLTVLAVHGTMPGVASTNNAGVYWTTVETGSINADLRFYWNAATEVGNPLTYSALRRANGTTEVVPAPGSSIDLIDYTVEFFGITDFDSSSVPGVDSPNGEVTVVPYGWTAGLIGTTAGSSDIAGRVLSSNGRGLRDVTVTLMGGDLQAPVTVRTNQFGRYRFTGLESGSTYVVSVSSQRYSFGMPVKVVYLGESLAAEDFIADPR